MARPGSQATAGYFPTPEHLIPAIAGLVSFEGERWGRPLLFDPCAGTGTALLRLASELLGVDEAEAAISCLAIELETTRARVLQDRLSSSVAEHADAFSVGLSPTPGASVLFLNPPYDRDAEHGRLEQRFLARFTEALAPGGALLFVLPHYALAASAEFLASHYSDVGVFRFPQADFAAFRQVVVVGKRRPAPIPVDRFTAKRLAAAAESAEGLPVLDAPDPPPPLAVELPAASLGLHPQAIDVQGLLEQSRPFSPSAALMGFDRDCRQLLGAPLRVALPPRPAHIALALASGLLNGRHLEPNDPSLPSLLVKGTFSRPLQQVDVRHNKDGDEIGTVCVQQPRLDIHVLRLDTLTFHQLALGTEASGAEEVEEFNTADLFGRYSTCLARLVREQLPALHDPNDPAHQIELPELARRPFRVQAACIQAGLKLLALGENPQGLAEVGTGKSTVALSIAAALAPEHFAHTTAELARVGFDPRRLRPVRRLLIVCPPHLLDSWVDQARAVVPHARVQLVENPSDLDRPAWLYILSREKAKLGSAVAGVGGRRCPDCAHPLPDESRKTLATRRMRCEAEVVVPIGEVGEIVRDLALAGYRYLPPETAGRLLAYLEAHPAAHRRALLRHRGNAPAAPIPAEPPAAFEASFNRLMALVEHTLLTRSSWEQGFWEPLQAAAHLALVLGRFEQLAIDCRRLAIRRMEEASTSVYPREIEESLEEEIAAVEPLAGGLAEAEDPGAERSELFEFALGRLLALAQWEARPGCGAALHSVTPHPRRFPLARYIVQKRRRHFDFLVLDEAHEFSAAGSAQQKAAHRLVELPGVPTLILTGSIMGGYASSLFTNTWALSRRFRREFELTDKADFVTRYGYRKLLVANDGAKPLAEIRSFGRHTDRTDGDGPQVRQLGEAPGVLPLFVLEHVLPTALVMHKSDLDEELPPLAEEPVPLLPPPGDFLAAKLLAEFDRLRSALVAQIQEDRGTDRAGLLWGAMSELPAYLDLASAECGEFVLRYPEHAGGEVVAVGGALPAEWRSPKERWLVDQLAGELAADRRVLVFLRHTGNRGFVQRLQRLVFEEVGQPPTFLDPARVPTKTRERWLDKVVDQGCRVLFVHPKAVQTGLNNLTAFHTAVWYEGPDFDARVTRQANGRPHRIGQVRPVRLLYPYYARTVQKTALDLVARKITASLQVDGVSLAGALEAAGALSDEDRLHTTAALAFGQALFRAAAGEA